MQFYKQPGLNAAGDTTFIITARDLTWTLAQRLVSISGDDTVQDCVQLFKLQLHFVKTADL